MLFDDELVEPVDKSYVQNFFGDRPGLACAYVLFYQETTSEAVKREHEAEGRALATKATVEVPPKENLGLGLKTNGFMNGIHQVKSAVSPASPDEGTEILEKMATEPPPASTNSMHMNGDLTALPQVPASASPAEEVKSKKERQREEKERRAAARLQAKEEEIAERERRKTEHLKRREMVRKQETETKLAIAASKASKAEEDAKVALENGVGPTNVLAGGLSRLKTTSKSFKKPKFLAGNSWDVNREEPIADGLEDPSTLAIQPAPERAEKSADRLPDKAKNRFSALKKKTSNMML